MPAFLPVALVVSCLGATPTNTSPLRVELDGAADELREAIHTHKLPRVAVGAFTNGGKLTSSFGVEIQRVLGEALRAPKIDNRDAFKVDPEAEVEIRGTYRNADDDPDIAIALKGLTFLRIEFEFAKRGGDKIAAFGTTVRAVFSNETVARAYAIPLLLDPKAAPYPDDNRALRKSLDRPQAALDGAKILGRDKGLFAIEILTVAKESDDDPAAGTAPELRDGLAHVTIRGGEQYRVKVHNDAAFDVAVRLSIDGLPNHYIFSEEPFRSTDLQHIIVPAKKSGVIRGWFVNMSRADAFTVTDYAQSAAAELKASRQAVGQICVQFHAAWRNDAGPPADEPATVVGGKDVGTGRGKPLDQNLGDWVGTVGVFREQVTVRYAK